MRNCHAPDNIVLFIVWQTTWIHFLFSCPNDTSVWQPEVFPSLPESRGAWRRRNLMRRGVRRPRGFGRDETSSVSGECKTFLPLNYSAHTVPAPLLGCVQWLWGNLRFSLCSQSDNSLASSSCLCLVAFSIPVQTGWFRFLLEIRLRSLQISDKGAELEGFEGRH